jgi:lactate dehydrogenase-like 2-hydroxyacid dehydrogenase
MPDKPKVVFSRGLAFVHSRFTDAYTVLEWPKEGVEDFAREHSDIRAIVGGGGRRYPEPIETLPNLGLVAIVGSGFEGIDAPAFLARGVEVTHSPGGNAQDVADHAVALFLALAREVMIGDRRMREGLWVEVRILKTLRSVRDLRIGILGMGAIGVAIAERLRAFGCQIAWYGPNPKPQLPYPRAASLMDLARDSDVLFLAARADDPNRGIVDRSVIEALGPQGILINVARGLLVDEEALVAALRDGRLGSAGLDVFLQEPVKDTRWADVPNVVLTPHTGGAGLGAWEAQIAMIRDNLERFFSGRPVATPIPR